MRYPTPVQPADYKLYETLWSKAGWAHTIRFGPANRMRQNILANLAAPHIEAGRTVCDFGCGDGTLLSILQARSPQPARFFGIDLVTHHIENPSFSLIKANLSDPNIQIPEKMDVGLSSEVLEHVPDPKQALVNIFSSLKPGGILFLSVPSGPIFSFDERVGHLRHFAKKDLERLLKEAGFTGVRVWKFGFPFHTIYKSLVHFFSTERQQTMMDLEPKGFLKIAFLSLVYFLIRISVVPFGGFQIFASARRP